MKLDIGRVADGLHNGEVVWICDYRYNSFDNKPTRHVQPKKVEIVSNTETKQIIYYSESFFREVGKKSSVIKLYDNTGYRSFPGVALQMFTTEDECTKAYFAAKKKLKADFLEYKQQIIKRLAILEQELS